MLMLLIIHRNKNSRSITYEYLTEKLSMTIKEIDSVIASLVEKHYLSISADASGMVFNVEEIFEFDPEKYELAENYDLYQSLDLVFKRPLSQIELQKANDLMEQYGEKGFVDAVRIAEANRKVSMAYIEGILKNNEKK